MQNQKRTQKMSKKRKDTMEVEIHGYAIKNEFADEWLDIECHFEGSEDQEYVTLKIETSEEFTINSLEDLDELYNKIKELWPMMPNKKK